MKYMSELAVIGDDRYSRLIDMTNQTSGLAEQIENLYKE